MNISEISKSNAAKLGLDANRLQTIEECSELIQAICKYNRVMGVGQKTETKYTDAIHNLIEEVADVSICLEQLVYLHNIADEVEEARQIALEKVKKRYEVENDISSN